MHSIDFHGANPPHKHRSGKRVRPRAKTRTVVERRALGGGSAGLSTERRPIELRTIDAYYASERDTSPL